MRKLKRKESDVLSSVLALLKARGIFAIRMNTGAFEGEYKGRKRFVRFGVPGMADVLAIVNISEYREAHQVIWIECKSSSGNQSAVQRQFQEIVETEGMIYLLVRSGQEVNDWLEAHGA